MVQKSPILPNRVRRVPESFSWLDHRLVRDRYINNCSHCACCLYLFLVCVSDNKGLSYYGDSSIMQILSMDQMEFENARTEIINHNMIAWKKPLYQVLSLEPPKGNKKRSGNEMTGIADILKSAWEGKNDRL